MKSKQLTTLIVLTGALVLGALVVRQSKQAAMPELGRLLFPDLRLNDITRVEVESAGGKAVLIRKNDVWVCESRYDYPIRFDALRESLLALSKLDSSQRVQLSEKQREAVNLLPPSADKPDTSGTRVTWSYGAETTPAGSILIGRNHHKNIPGVSEQHGGYPDGQFFALETSGDAYLSPELLEGFSAAPEVWLNSDILNLGADKVSSVTLRYTNAEALSLPRGEGSASLTVPGMKKKEEVVSEKLMSIAGALNYLTLTDVADPALTDEALGFSKVAGADFVTTDGIQYTLSIGGTKEGRNESYIRVAASVLPPAGTNAPPQTAEGPAPADTVKNFNERFAKWTFVVPSYKIEPLQFRRSDLVKEKGDEDDSEKNEDE